MIMRNPIAAGAIAIAVVLTGCGKNQNASQNSPEQTNATASALATNAVPASSQPTVSVSTPVAQPILTTWQEGHQSSAVAQFVAANWNGRPLFPNGMALNFTDADLNGLQPAGRQLKAVELDAQIGLIEQIVTAVNNAGQQAASKGDTAQAKEYFTALANFGAALDDPARPQVVRHVGMVAKNMAKNGLTTPGP